MTLDRRKPLRRGTPLRADPEKAREWSRRSKPIKAKPKRRTPEEVRVRDAVFARDRRCLLAGHGRVLGTLCGGEPRTYHHLLKEGQGGAYTVENGVCACSWHNSGVEDHPDEAKRLGLVVCPGLDAAEARRRRVAHGVVPR